MKLQLIQDSRNKAKMKKLGGVGEDLAITLLRDTGFEQVSNLNEVQVNYPYADILAKRNDKRYVISVKTRLKYERLGGLNPQYNLGRDWRLHATDAENEHDATAAWVAVQVDRTVCNVYFGKLALVEESNGIPMQPEALPYYECLAENFPHDLDMSEYTPDYKVRVIGRTS